MKQLNISHRVVRDITILTVALVLIGAVFARQLLFAAGDTEELFIKAENSSLKHTTKALAAHKPYASKAAADETRTKVQPKESTESAMGSEVASHSELAGDSSSSAEYIPPPAEPGDYPAHPPLCGSLRNIGGDGPDGPPVLQAKIVDYQTNVVVSRYDFYVNDILKQSSSSDVYTFNETTPDKYLVHVIMDTNFGTTLKNVHCVAGPFIVN